MEIQTPFVTPIAICDFSKYIPFLVQRFEETGPMEQSKSPGHTTNLDYYAIDGHTCDRLGDSKEAEELRTAIAATTQEFAAKLGYAAGKYMPITKNFWLNEMISGGVHPRHSHYGNHFSGCMYVQMPENAAQIKFSNPNDRYDKLQPDVETYTPGNSATWSFSPKVGQLFIWESWLNHEVPATQFEGVRRSAAFDVILKRI